VWLVTLGIVTKPTKAYKYLYAFVGFITVSYQLDAWSWII
jgi:hypothetical protein